MADNKGFDLASVMASVSSLDTGAQSREQIEYIDIDKIHADPNNFYTLEGIEELANNIELIGLQQPPRVRPDPDREGEFVLISGHRRRAAVQLLVDEGKEQFRLMPVIREQPAASEALQELKLIFANSDTRRMTSAEVSKQAERVEMLLYQLKEEMGEEYFPGKMRDYVAECCKVSASKLARLKVIRENLIPTLKGRWECGEINETASYVLAKLPTKVQQDIATYAGPKTWWTEQSVNVMAECARQIRASKCFRDKRPCINWENRMRHGVGDDNGYYCKACCNKCYYLATCEYACPRMEEKIKNLKADAKAKKKAEKEVKAKKNQPAINLIRTIWDRTGRAMAQADLSLDDFYEAVDYTEYYRLTEDDFQKMACLEGKYTTATYLPFGLDHPYNTNLLALIKAANVLGCSTDYLLGLTDEPTPTRKDEAPGKHWLHLSFINALIHPTPDDAMLEEAGLFYCVFDCDGDEMHTTAKWVNGWCFPGNLASIDAKCLKYFPLPKES